MLIAVVDDATKRVLYAQLWPAETATAILTALREVVTTYGLPMALYTLEIATGAMRIVYEASDWLNHVMMSPTDPTVIMDILILRPG